MAQDPQVWIDALDEEAGKVGLSDDRKAEIAAERKKLVGVVDAAPRDVPEVVETADAAPAPEDTAAPKPRRRRG